MTGQNSLTVYQLNDTFLLCRIEGVPYLLPFGQAIAEFRHGLKLNETGFLLLRALEYPTNVKKLSSILAEYYHASLEEMASIEQDVQDFLTPLLFQNIIRILPKSKASGLEPDLDCSYMRIGPLVLCMQIPKKYIEPSFWDFSCAADTLPDLLLRYIPTEPPSHKAGMLLIHTQELTIHQLPDKYVFQFQDGYGILEMYVTLDGSRTDFYCPPPHPEQFCENLFHAIRFAYLIRAQFAGLFAIHSASILYRRKAWLFSAPSGTGKSTHTALWKKLFEASDINGDLNLLGFQNGKPVVYGIPWCGTSGIYTKETYPLGGIVFLRQAPADTLIPLDKDQRIMHIADRLISPTWIKKQYLTNLAFAQKLAPLIQIFALHCTKEDSAAYKMKQAVDDALDKMN